MSPLEALEFVFDLIWRDAVRSELLHNEVVCVQLGKTMTHYASLSVWGDDRNAYRTVCYTIERPLTNLCALSKAPGKFIEGPVEIFAIKPRHRHTDGARVDSAIYDAVGFVIKWLEGLTP